MPSLKTIVAISLLLVGTLIQIIVKYSFGFTFDVVIMILAVFAFFFSFGEYIFLTLVASLFLSWAFAWGPDMTALIVASFFLFWISRLLPARPLAVLSFMIIAGIFVFYALAGGLSFAVLGFLAGDIAVMLVCAVFLFQIFQSYYRVYI